MYEADNRRANPHGSVREGIFPRIVKGSDSSGFRSTTRDATDVVDAESRPGEASVMHDEKGHWVPREGGGRNYFCSLKAAERHLGYVERLRRALEEAQA